MSRAWIYGLLLLAAGCADGVRATGETCDDERPCAEGLCVAGVCQPVDEPRPDAAAEDAAPLADTDPLGDAAQPDGALPPVDMSPDVAPPDPDMAPPDPDMAPPDPDMGPPDDCGRYGEVCCPGDTCLTGGCIDGVCVQFGGVWAIYGEPGNDLCAGNPLAFGACLCPEGFVDHALEDLDGNTDEGSGWPTRIHVCGPRIDVPESDFRASIGEETAVRDPICPVSCTQQPEADACGCPAGSEVYAFDGMRYRRNPEPDCSRRATLCGSRAPLTFGGAYRSYRPTSRVCQDEMPPSDRCVPNPLTGACTCPPGFDPVTIPAMGPHSVRGFEWFCRADMVVCVGRP